MICITTASGCQLQQRKGLHIKVCVYVRQGCGWTNKRGGLVAHTISGDGSVNIAQLEHINRIREATFVLNVLTMFPI